MKLTYHQEGDYLFPDLTITEENMEIGKYGMLRETFLKEHRRGWYQSLLLSGKLNQHLEEVENAARERMEVMVEGILEKHPAPDKKADPTAWTAYMNAIIAMAEEIVLRELVYG